MKGTKPLLMSSPRCKQPINPQADAVQNWTPGIPNSSAAFIPKLMIPSDIIKLTLGIVEQVLSLFLISSNKGPKQFFLVDSHSNRISCVASLSEGGKPSGIVSNWKLRTRSKNQNHLTVIIFVD